MIACILMASGFSRRLGVDKLRLKYKGKSLLERTIERLKSAGVEEIILVYREVELLDLAQKHQLKAVYNKDAELGQSQSIKYGLENVSPEAEGYMFAVADQPYMRVETVEALIELFEMDKSKIVLPTSNQRRGNPVIFPRELRYELLTLEGDNGGKSVIVKNSDRLRLLEVDEIELFDIDTAEDLRRLEEAEWER